MSGNFLKDHLPWIAPSAAIVLAASGYFENLGLFPGRSGPAPAAVAQPAYAGMPALTQQDFTAQAATVALQPALPPVTQTTPIPAQTVPPQPVTAQRSAQTAAVAPLTEAPEVSRNLTPEFEAPARPAQPAAAPVPTAEDTEGSAAFFRAAQAELAKESSCIDDLRKLTEQARIYFPSGGVTGEAAGLAQARLIGIVAQDCPNVQIRVEGHSDPSGDPAVNLRLSQQRAEAIVDRIAASGVDTANFVAKGFGDTRPATVRGDGPSAYYDRRVEFSVISLAQPARVAGNPSAGPVPRCVTQLQQAVAETRLFFAPRSITVSETDLAPVYQLAAQTAACSGARLRVVGQHADAAGSGETPATGRLRAIALMGMLVSAGFEPDQIIIAAPSTPTRLPGRDGLSDRRIDFDVIVEDRL